MHVILLIFETCKITKVFFSRAKAKVIKHFKEKKKTWTQGVIMKQAQKTNREKGFCWDHDMLGLWVPLMKPASYWNTSLWTGIKRWPASQIPSKPLTCCNTHCFHLLTDQPDWVYPVYALAIWDFSRRFRDITITIMQSSIKSTR